jgi:hypothetical protein
MPKWRNGTSGKLTEEWTDFAGQLIYHLSSDRTDVEWPVTMLSLKRFLLTLTGAF